MKQFGPEEFRRATDVSRETIQRLSLYAELLRRWQARINLVAPSTLDTVWHRHFLDSAQLVPLLPPDAAALTDLGSGAGFPGLVLKILRPDLAVTLIDSDQRKAAFLAEVARAVGLPVTIRCERLESLTGPPSPILTARACAPLAPLLDYARPLLLTHTICLFHKGERYEEELTAARRYWTMAATVTASVTDRRGVILSLRDVVHV